MRIVGGRFRGLSLAALGKGDAGAHLRPTTDRVRESLFSMLQGGRFNDPLSEAVVLDLFAGTGALGLEALSRGARHVTFVENGRVGQRLIGENIAKARADDETRIIKRDARRLGLADGNPANLIFLDPPYGKNLGTPTLSNLARNGWIAGGALIIWEERSEQIAPDGFTVVEARAYGDTTITFLTKD